MHKALLTFRTLRVSSVFCFMLVLASIGWTQELGSNIPPDQTLTQQRAQEGGNAGSGIFDVAAPPPGTILRPVLRVPRQKYGVVGAFPLTLQDLDGLIYPNATAAERQAVLEGMTFFTKVHDAGESPLPDSKGVGPMANQPFCLGCHMSTAEQIRQRGLLNPDNCKAGSTCVSLVSRAARSTPTNFRITSLNPATGGGVAPAEVLANGTLDPNASLDAVNGPGRTAAFTVFGDFGPVAAGNCGAGPLSADCPGIFDPLDGAFTNPITGAKQALGGFVQHVRPSLDVCVPKPIPPVSADANLMGAQDPATGLWPSGFRRTVGERAGPPYIGRGLMEAIPTADILANADPDDSKGHNSSLGNYAALLGCNSDCIAGHANMIPRTLTLHTDANGNLTSVTGSVGGVGRFGLRANGVEILQFAVGGLQGELSFTSLFNNAEVNFPMLFPTSGPTTEPAACMAALSTTPEVHLSEPFSERNFIRNTAPPEFGDKLLKVLRSRNPRKASHGDDDSGKVARGAELFGIDLMAFANRMIPGRMPRQGDGLDPNAINQSDRKLDCVGCHTPIQRTGQSPADVGAEHLSFVWAPIFSDLLLHKMPSIDAERNSTRPRDPFLVTRRGADGEEGDDAASNFVGAFAFDGREHGKGRLFQTYDLRRNFADDAFSNLKGTALGTEFRTAPLMGIGRMGAPFMHDARVYLSRLTVNTTPAGTVTTNRRATNAPLVVRSLEEALLAAIELHDLPAPDDSKTPKVVGAGCPVPPAHVNSNVDYGPSPEDVICPAYGSATSKATRSDSREVIRRFRALSPEDQQALIEFLKQL